MTGNDKHLMAAIDAAKDIGPVKWGGTHEFDPAQHAEHVKASVEMTSSAFDQPDTTRMYGVYLADGETVLCHTGTSPNSAIHAQIIAGLWNRFIEEAAQHLASEQDQTEGK